jgi:hypothetical protein
VSLAYGVAQEAPVADFVLRGDGVVEWLTLMAPVKDSGLVPQVTSGTVEVEGATWTDVVLTGLSDHERGSSPSGDFGWLWLRRHHDQPDATEVGAIDARSVSVPGAFTLDAERPVPWLSARLSSHSLELALDAGQRVALGTRPSVRALIVNGTARVCEEGRTRVVVT